MTETLELTGVADGWIKVNPENERAEYVSMVKIAGCELELSTISDAKITCDEYSFVRDYHPALLVERPEWYTAPDE